jgi:hypothetical protein
MPNTTRAKTIKRVLDKFDPIEAAKILDLLLDEEEKGHVETKEEEDLRIKLERCLEAYERTAAMLERG